MWTTSLGITWTLIGTCEALPPNEITRLGMGLVPEDRRIFPGLSVEGNLKLGLMQVQASERKVAEQRIQMVFERFPPSSG